MTAITDIFEKARPDEKELQRLEGIPDPQVRYVIAMTPRSGSSHLCDVMKGTGLLGSPGEFLPREFIPNILKGIAAKNPDQYVRNVLRAVQSGNGVSGLKTSWFQFQQFSAGLQDRSVFRKFKFIYLVRRDLAAQAVSLYKATESSVFHTNIEHTREALSRLDSLEYDFSKLRHWYDHIAAQETGWQKYFASTNTFPLCITYEDIEADVMFVVRRIAAYLGLPKAQLDKSVPSSIFRKLADKRNLEWACRFMIEKYDREAESPARDDVATAKAAP
jgi:LPS sulfotransferase NodH